MSMDFQNLAICFGSQIWKWTDDSGFTECPGSAAGAAALKFDYQSWWCWETHGVWDSDRTKEVNIISNQHQELWDRSKHAKHPWIAAWIGFSTIVQCVTVISLANAILKHLLFWCFMGDVPISCWLHPAQIALVPSCYHHPVRPVILNAQRAG